MILLILNLRKEGAVLPLHGGRMAFRPAGMSDSDDSEDDFYYGGSTTKKPNYHNLPPPVQTEEEVN